MKIFTTYFKILILCVLLSCCTAKPDLKKEIENLGITITNDVNYVFILTDNFCVSCNIKFANFLKGQINNTNNIIIVNSKGLMFDITTFNENKSERLKVIQSRKKVFEHSKVVIFDKSELQDEILLNVKNISSVLSKIN